MMSDTTKKTANAHWHQFRLTVQSELVDPLSELLDSIGAAAVTTENAGDDEFYEVAFPGTPSWETVRVTALFNEDADIKAIQNLTLSALKKIGVEEIPHTLEKLADQDWERVWLDSFSPIKVGKDLWVVPSWCDPVEIDSRNIRLDPGLAFGTGTHATTFMCLDWISRQHLKTQTVLDYGSGSGILAIASIMSGAEHADAVDIDPLAVEACELNAQRNTFADVIISESMRAYLPNDLPDPIKTYDLVIANILAEVILMLKDTLIPHVAPSGTLLLTGILKQQSDKIMVAFSESFDFTVQEKDHWVLLIGRRR
jgi:ribosomal protein L11 methyltransferase